jgi:hypothetical protein
VGSCFTTNSVNKQAQEAQKLVTDLQNSNVFQKAIDNLDMLWKQRQDGVLRNAEDQMKANLAVLRTWNQVDEFLIDLSGRIGQDQRPKLNENLMALKRQEAETRTALKELKEKIAALPNPAAIVNRLGAWFDDIGKLDQIVDFGMAKAGAEAEQAAAAKLAALATQYKAFTLSLPASPGCRLKAWRRLPTC